MDKNLNITAIVQARMDSTRLPGKTMKKVLGKPLIELLLKRLSLSKKLKKIVVAIPHNRNNERLSKFLNKKKYNVFRGDPKNVLKRFYNAAKKNKCKIIVRITGDCPLIDAEIVDNLIEKLIRYKKDYVTNTFPPTFPDGLDVEVFTFKALKRCYKLARSDYDKEHVTPFIKKSGKFSILNIKNITDLSEHRWTVDKYNDLKVIRSIFNSYKPRIDFGWKSVMSLHKKKPSIFMHNKLSKLSEKKSSGQKLWKRAKKIIPGGNMFLSKRPEMFLPDKWPVYYTKAKGCEIWDLDGKKYVDMALMGVGTNILGYSNKRINDSVAKALKKSNVSSLNCYEEVLLSERLIKLHPWANMVKLARTGGEANSIAVRVARAATGKDKIAFCGYHGWHDWYLSANIADKKNLNNQLLENLETKGVPKALKNTSFPFEYNNFKQLERITRKNDIGVIKMEVSRNIPPKNNFLRKVRKLADKKKIVLIFDECTSGFRENFGGLHKLYKVEPDIAIFGKALGNGHPITAIIGKKKIMEHAQDSFISSTFWTERSGPVAALKTLELMEKMKSWKIISKIGRKIDSGWKKLGKKHKLKIKCYGLKSIKSFEIKSKHWLKYKTFISQEMLKKGFLAGNTIFTCISHNDKIIKKYFNSLDEVFKIISKCEKDNQIDTLLETTICQTGFKRLN